MKFFGKYCNVVLTFITFCRSKDKIRMVSTFSQNRRTTLTIFLIVLIFILGSLLHFFRGYFWSENIYPHMWGVDDAYISYRYGWNLVHFDQLAWNESGFRKTEGFTNPLWVVVSALWSLFDNKDWVYPGVVATSVSLSALLLYITQKLILQKYETTKALAGIFLVAITPFVWADATSGLESVVFGFCLALLAYLSINSDLLDKKQLYMIIVLSFIACLVRSDGAIYVGIIFVCSIISKSQSTKWVLLGALAGYSILSLFRFFYFGTFLPTTALAKLNFGVLERFPIGLEILFIILVNGGCAFLFAGIVGLRNAEKLNIRVASACILLGWYVYYIYIGGDIYRERHLIGVFAYGGIISASYWHKKKLIDIVKVSGVLLVLIFLPLFFFEHRFSYWLSKPDDPMISMGKTMAMDRQRYGTVAIGAAGKTPFFAGGDFVDTLGLNDPYLATVKRPKFIPGHSAGSDEEAIEIARQHSPDNYSFLTFSPSPFLKSPADVLLWTYGNRPQDAGVHDGFTSEEWNNAIVSSSPMYLCVLIDKPH